MEKNGEFVIGKSRSDFDMTKVATYADAEGFAVADDENRQELKNPKQIVVANPERTDN